MQQVRWGILGCGNIARKFVQAVDTVEQATVTAAASRSIEKAQKFAQKWDIPLAFGSYDELLYSGKVDAVYIATPHNTHFELARQALLADVPVLCEKPFTVCAVQAKELLQIAQQRKVFCMEAMWTRFLPVMSKLQELIGQGKIGEVQRVAAQYCFAGEFDPASRLWAPELAGGALLDVGVYPLTLAAMVLGSKPNRIQAACLKCETGVDETTVVRLDYGQATAHLSCGISMQFPAMAVIEGTKGKIQIPQFYAAEHMEIMYNNGTTETIELPFDKNGFEYEIEEVVHNLRAKQWQSALLPLEESVRVMELLDEIRRQCAITYPFLSECGG